MKAEHEQVVKDIFLAIGGRIWELERAIRPEGRPANAQHQWSAEEMLTSRVGRDLTEIVASAEGSQVSPLRIRHAIEGIYRVLFGLMLENGYNVPQDFYRTPLGQILNQALVRMYPQEELMTAREVQRELNVARQTVYDWIEEGKLTPLYINGKIMVPRSQVEEFKNRRKQRGERS